MSPQENSREKSEHTSISGRASHGSKVLVELAMSPVNFKTGCALIGALCEDHRDRSHGIGFKAGNARQ
jgi:hypothetical protein